METLRALEERRCAAVAEGDEATLRELLSPRLVHVHGRGNRDDLDSYLAHITGKIEVLRVDRVDLEIQLHGDCAVMTGGQTNTARLRGTSDEPIQVESRVMQVWVRAESQWQQVAFQATLIGAPPPAAR